MAKVLFPKGGWFGPGGKRYRKSQDKFDYREVADAHLPFLPKTAVRIDKPEARPDEKPDSLRDLDIERAAGDQLTKAGEDADADYAELQARRRRESKRGR